MRSTYEIDRVHFAADLSQIRPSSNVLKVHHSLRDHHSLPGFVLGEWYPLPLVRTRCTPSHTPCVYHMLAVEVELRREHFFYDINYVLLAGLLSTLAFGVLFVPVDSFADRCSITPTLLLTAVAFKQVLADKIPNNSYLTLIEQVPRDERGPPAPARSLTGSVTSFRGG